MSRSYPLPEFGSVVRMTVQDVINWLSENKLNDSIKKFRQAGVDGNKLVHITSTDLRNINVSKSDAKTILELVSQVRKPNDRRGNFNNFAAPEPVSDQESDDGGWGDEEFDDYDDGTHARPRAVPNTYIDAPKPIPRKRNIKKSEEFQAPVAPPRPNRSRGGPLPTPPPPANQSRPPKIERRRPQTPPQPQEDENYEDPYQSRYPAHRDPSPQQTYEDPDNARIPQRNQNGRPPAPTPSLPSRGGRAPPPTPQYPDPQEQEVYEEVDEADHAPAPPPPRSRGRLPSPSSEEEQYEDMSHHKADSTDGVVPESNVTIPQTEPQELYENTTIKLDGMVIEHPATLPPPPRRTAPVQSIPPEPEDYEQVDKPVTAPPSRAPTLPHRPNQPNLPPPPRIPVQQEEQETYEVPDVVTTTQSFRGPQLPVPQRELPQRPPARKPVQPAVESDEENYIEPETKPMPPPARNARMPAPPSLITPQRKNTPPPIKRERTPPRRVEEPRRTLPPPPKGASGYNRIEVSAKGTPVLMQESNNSASPQRKASSENLEGYLEGQKFYHGEISRQDAEEKLRQYNVDGMYLIRKSTKNANQPYTLQMYYQGYIYNLPINKASNGRYTISNEKAKEFQTIREMVNHFKQHKLILKGGKETILKESLPKS